MRPFLTSFSVILWLISSTAFSLEIPKNLSRSDRQDVIRLLGFSTSTKLLTNPYPLGGWSGLEIGFSVEAVNISDLSRLGDKTTPESELRYPRLTVGKGLYYNVDMFIHFTPPTSDAELSDYGGLVRWAFYEAKYLPVNMSLLIHGSHINIKDLFTHQTVGAELLFGINANNFALYFGGGPLEGHGKFVADSTNSIVNPSDPAVDSTTNRVTESVSQSHTFAGISLHFHDLFAAFQIDRYKDVAYSAKVGLRF